eukprot:TRINITY_DN2315_c0_g1_i10.p1 TRINITY_DN2315_c0_g1~~TRINITY_DN2315_c0_g1_i10.p1  ORF type:complete len:156 (-),score=32.99 TRINITY_DN2315_c0_g1_i10:375-842(-)
MKALATVSHPRNFSESGVTDSTVQLSWDAPIDGAEMVVGYEVQISNEGNMQVQVAPVHETDALKRRTLVKNLQELTEYTFRVRALAGSNSSLEGSSDGKRELCPWSAPIRVSTAYDGLKKDAFSGMSAHHRTAPKKPTGPAVNEDQGVCKACVLM